MIKFLSISILIAIVLFNWKLFIPKSWYESEIANIENLVLQPGYLLEKHDVKTEDGYILTLHRIPSGRNEYNKKRKPPIFLMHGLLCSSIDWVVNGPNRSMGLVLADAGYDVWLGNHRGNKFSRHHVSLDPNIQKKQFFNFSYHEIGMYDLPAMIDYVLNITDYKQLTYLGFSQGFTSFLVMGSLRPEYNDKILLMNGFGPIPAYLGMYELLDHDQASILRWMGTIGPISENIFYMMGSSIDQVPDRKLRNIISENFPAGMSLKQLTHYIQGLTTGIFGQYDYGKDENVLQYGSPSVPLYNLSKVTAPIILYYGEDDILVNNEILLHSVAKELPNVVKKFLVPYPQFNHVDFIYGKDVKKLNDEALENINKYNRRTS